ncbi:hypothetical protein [Oharaeibacter diazotrophicus]|uniref:Beta/gamma crystallin n=1 Tax=Oharaeibacter diazotrophicus TaxID=1920512 RepID=A0A4R6RLM1_9HYPH|nr:hypothetical protein [Oharaeibacter diazotrophicus]TDP86636.1 hypothetical protein EDD54_0515 [Oharaeibacter diazotrophicus]BBE71422.1 hypothetical protein OHA_1_00996 [Pleomorphomonas sp. SM30]GLS78181.1 hypothetical protein GCM10007904_35180 [Oharaeibacter diazotrophicus]
MIRFRCVLAASVVAVLSAAPAFAIAPSPYDMTYRIRGGGETALLADMKEGAGRVGTIPAGAEGIVLRWCRSEIPFGAWQFGSRKEQLKLLDARWCEVSYKGKVGDVPGSALEPE